MMFCRRPTSDSRCSSTETVVAMTITPNISGSSIRAMIRLPPKRSTCEATSETRFHAPAPMARLRRLAGACTSIDGMTSISD
ncbi:hypothetical protein D3C75_1070000 [compost metagenome]